MKRYKMIFTALAVCAVVSSAFALGNRSQKDLLFCTNDAQPQLGVCVLQGIDTQYSSIDNDNPVTPIRPVYKGAANTPCVAPTCPRFTQQVFSNQ